MINKIIYEKKKTRIWLVFVATPKVMEEIDTNQSKSGLIKLEVNSYLFVKNDGEVNIYLYIRIKWKIERLKYSTILSINTKKIGRFDNLKNSSWKDKSIQ